MPLILIKNNLKLMIRSKWILFMMIIGPVLTGALLSNAFKDMMSNAYVIKDFNAGYRISADNRFRDSMEYLAPICKKQGITLQEYPQGDIDKLLKSEAVSTFVDIKKDSYVIYQASDKDKEAAVIASVFNSFFYQTSTEMTVAAYAMANGITVADSVEKTAVHTEKLNSDPIPDSTDYYGIIYIVYFAWCGMLCLAEVISSERKGAVPRRIRVAHMPKISYYLGKFIPCTLAVFIQLCCAALLSALLLGVHWGRPWLSAILLFVLSVAVSTFGMVLYQIFKKVAISTVVGFVIIWVMGFFGGSFEPYMYLSVPMTLIHSSPIYYIDRTLVELSISGSSSYLGITLMFMAAFIAVCGMIGILLMNRKMEEA